MARLGGAAVQPLPDRRGSRPARCCLVAMVGAVAIVGARAAGRAGTGAAGSVQERLDPRVVIAPPAPIELLRRPAGADEAQEVLHG